MTIEAVPGIRRTATDVVDRHVGNRVAGCLMPKTLRASFPLSVLLAGALSLGACSDSAPPADEERQAGSDAVSPARLVGVETPSEQENSAGAGPESPGEQAPAESLQTLMQRAADASFAGEEQRMVSALEVAIKAYPSEPGPRIALGRYYMLKKDSASALALLDDFAGDAEQTPALLTLYGAAQIAEGQYPEARETLESLREIQPENAAMHFQLSKIYAQLGEVELMKPSLERAIELDPEGIEAHIAMARYHMLVGDREAAAEEIRLLQGLAPENADVVSLVTIQEKQETLIEESNDVGGAMEHAQARLAAGDLPAALSGYRAVLEIDPENVEAMNNLAWFSRDVDPAAALGYARKAASLSPESPLVLDTLAMVLVANQKPEEAVQTIEKALALAPDQPGIMLHSARIFYEAGDTGRARQILERLAGSEEDSVEKSQALRLLQALDRDAAKQG